jgi:hypothetical protein
MYVCMHVGRYVEDRYLDLDGGSRLELEGALQHHDLLVAGTADIARKAGRIGWKIKNQGYLYNELQSNAGAYPQQAGDT